MELKQKLLRSLPQIDELLGNGQLVFLLRDESAGISRTEAVKEARALVQRLREEILSGRRTEVPELDCLAGQVKETLLEKKRASLVRLVNATGIVLHTNLGRAGLSERAVRQVTGIAGNYSNLEYDLEKGGRGVRHDHVQRIITGITGAGAAMVVNNNAAATLLCLAALACGREVIISRGELVEIGGSFRIPEICAQSGARLKEVGTTNKTHLYDYADACEAGTAGLLLKVHTSNYRLIGFTEDVPVEALVKLGHQYNLPVVYDLGSGLMLDLSRYGIDEPNVPDALSKGADLVLFSGDKLLGGPQAGVVIGKKEYIDRMKRHPLARALRVDKMTIAALEATFAEYLDMKQAKERIPVLSMIIQTEEALKEKAMNLAAFLRVQVPDFTYTVVPCDDQVGGGSVPGKDLPGAAVAVAAETASPQRIEALLRSAKTPVIARISHGQVLFCVRTVRQDEFSLVAEACRRAAGMLKKEG